MFYSHKCFHKTREARMAISLTACPNRTSYIPHTPLISTLATTYPNAVSHTAVAPNALLPGTCPLRRFIKKAKARHRPMFYTKENPRNKAMQRPSVLGYLLSCFINSAILPRRSIEYTPLSFSKYSKRLKAFCNSVSLSGADASVSASA